MTINKIDKYLKKFAIDIEYSVKSRYYTLPTGVIRVSDHIGRNSNAIISIIITDKNEYILHKHSNGKIINISYTDLKKLIKSLGEFGSLFSVDANNKMIIELKSDIANKNKTIENLKIENKKWKRKSEFANAFMAFRRLSHNQKLAVCTMFNKTDISELTTDELLSAMGKPVVQAFFKEKK